MIKSSLTIGEMVEHAIYRRVANAERIPEIIDKFIATGGNAKTIEDALDWAENNGYKATEYKRGGKNE